MYYNILILDMKQLQNFVFYILYFCDTPYSVVTLNFVSVECTFMCVYVCVHVHGHTCVDACIHACMQVGVCARARVHMGACMCVHACICVVVYVFTYVWSGAEPTDTFQNSLQSEWWG
jgi:hypothetical protein